MRDTYSCSDIFRIISIIVELLRQRKAVDMNSVFYLRISCRIRKYLVLKFAGVHNDLLTFVIL